MISILLPSLNQVPFLRERFDSIRAQTISDWELLVIDGFSDDGSWEIIEREAAQDHRIRAWQAPRAGVYAALNLGLRESRGELVYVATADDTMTPDCLAKLAAALARHPGCDVAHCCLTVADAHGVALEGGLSWDEQPIPKFAWGALRQREHVRPRPHDGFLYAATGTVYHSLHQLLVRREVFDRAGYFREDLGSKADFEWGMRVALLHGTVHVPEYLATWRRHEGQLTRDAEISAPRARREMAEMVRLARAAAVRIDPGLAAILDPRRLSRPLRHQAMLFERLERNNGLFFRFRQWLREPDLIGLDLANQWLWRGKYHRCHLAFIRKEMSRHRVMRPGE